VVGLVCLFDTGQLGDIGEGLWWPGPEVADGDARLMVADIGEFNTDSFGRSVSFWICLAHTLPLRVLAVLRCYPSVSNVHVFTGSNNLRLRGRVVAYNSF